MALGTGGCGRDCYEPTTFLPRAATSYRAASEVALKPSNVQNDQSSVPHFMPRGEPGSDWEWLLWSDLVDVPE
jgi:hypothetical protein